MINFHSEDVVFKLKNPRLTKSWLIRVAKFEGEKINTVNYIFCSDPYLLAINQEYLHHDYYTDILTFDNRDGVRLDGDIFISIDRVKENANEHFAPFEEELRRVIVHGLLHLLGYNDTTESAKATMRAKEDEHLLTYQLANFPRGTSKRHLRVSQ